MTKRFKLTLEYDGTDFSGWQRLREGASVQQTLEEAAYRFAGVETPVYGAGRTDAGVHATGQVAHLDLPGRFRAQTVQHALNYHVRPKRVVVMEAAEVDPQFHARFSATKRVYRYYILQRTAPPILAQHRMLHCPYALSYDQMGQAAHYLMGHHDFTSFRAQACQARSPHITLDRITLRPQEEGLMIELEARSFLHHMVRNIVGTLLMIGRGIWAPERISDILAAKNRSAAGPTAPPYGLYLHQVLYEE